MVRFIPSQKGSLTVSTLQHYSTDKFQFIEQYKLTPTEKSVGVSSLVSAYQICLSVGATIGRPRAFNERPYKIDSNFLMRRSLFLSSFYVIPQNDRYPHRRWSYSPREELSRLSSLRVLQIRSKRCRPCSTNRSEPCPVSTR